MSEVLSLRAAGVQLLLDVSGPSLPRVLHWGRDLGPVGEADLLAVWGQPVPRSALDQPGALTLLPDEEHGWSGTPGFAGHRRGGDSVAWWSEVQVGVTDEDAGAGDGGGGSVTVTATGAGGSLALAMTLTLDPQGVLSVASSVTNVARRQRPAAYDVGGTAGAAAPAAARRPRCWT